jgi:hypothetical protein
MKKIQTTLSADDESRLNQIINAVGLERDQVLSQPSYVRELIINHINQYSGQEQKSFVNENVKRLIRDLNNAKTK